MTKLHHCSQFILERFLNAKHFMNLALSTFEISKTNTACIRATP